MGWCVFLNDLHVVRIADGVQQDADLIMLSLATHEPHFRVLREDVFFNDTSSTACRLCGQEGHYAAQCKGEKKEKVDDNDTKKKPVTKKPFIFLDVSILREYLDAELNIATNTFPFDLERAIDDWVMLIFFVGNDFLPHLPSLEIREGAIDTLLKIWKNELPRMGGYITEHGRLNFTRLQVILTGLAGREDEIFRRRKEGSSPQTNAHDSVLNSFIIIAEDRQDQNAKRRKLEANRDGASYVPVKASSALRLASNPTPPSSTPAVPMRHALPPRPNFDSFESNANALGFGAVSPTTMGNQAAAITGITGSAHDWVANRKAIRMANMSAAEMLKAEMMAATPMAKPRSTASPPVISPIIESLPTPPVLLNEAISSPTTPSAQDIKAVTETSASVAVESVSMTTQETEPTSPQGAKRKHEELEKDDEKAEDGADDTFTVDPDLDDDEDAPGDTAEVVPKRIVNNNGTVEQEDTVK
jgi:5'-3' exoribonuclease 2